MAIAIAIALADAEGLEAVSTQWVAQESGYGTMSLYRYVDSKAGLRKVVTVEEMAFAGHRLLDAAEVYLERRRTDKG